MQPDLVALVFEGYPAPTLVVDTGLRVRMVNEAARRMFGGEVSASLLLSPIGDVLGCHRAADPLGCGHQDACGLCVIRDSVQHAFTTGGVQRAKTVLQVRRAGRCAVVCLLVSASPIHRDGEDHVVVTVEDVSEVVRLRTEFSRAEQASRETETLNRLLFDLAPSGVVLVDVTGRILQFNEQAHQQLGYTREEFAALNVADLDVEGDGAVRGRLAEVVERGGAELEVAHRHRDGHVLHRVVRARPIEIGGKPRVVAVWHDITERKRAELALRASEERYRSVFESSADPIVAVDLAGRFTEANGAMLRMLGYEREELLGLDHLAITPARWHAMNRAVLDHQVGERGYSDEYEKEYVRKDGSLVPVSVRAFAKRDGAGRRVGSWAIVRDVTERKRVEDALSRSEARFRALIEKSTDMIFVVDEESKIRFWSPSATEGLGWTADEVLGRSRFELVHPDDHGILRDALASVRTRGQGASQRIVTRTLHKDGSWRDVESEGRNLLADPAVRGIVVNSRDVTEQRRLEEQLRQAQKLDSIGRLAGGVAHDFNNLLTIVLSGAESLKADLAEGLEPDPAIVDEIGAAGKRARDLTRQLLAFARKQVIAPVPLDLGRLVAGAESLLRRVLGEDVEVVTAAEPGLWPVRCDPGQLEQVILNLAVNARDAMPGGGRLTIETGNAPADPGASHPLRAGPCVRLRVRDTGHGMTPDVKARLFEPFFTTKPAGVGTGLGLATAYGIVQQSGGQVAVESEPGRGTTFEIYLPRTLDPVVAPQPEPPPRTTAGTETVLVVEDDPHVREVSVRSLEAGGYRVLAASCGRDAIEVSAREQGPVHLLVTDVVMPGIDGRELARELRRRRPELRVLFVSGYARDAIGRDGELDAGIDFLPKPFTPSSLLERARSVLDRGADLAAPRVVAR